MKISLRKLHSLLPSLSSWGGIALLIPSSGSGQTAPLVTMDNPSSLVIQTATNQTYFLWESANLADWLPVNTYIVGDGTQKTIPIVPSGRTSFFYRFAIAPSNALNPDDTDGDGILNAYEMEFGLDSTRINSATDLAIAEIDSRIASKTAGDAMRIYNNYRANGANLIFERNPDCWINNIVNKSCISPWNSCGGHQRAGTLITPRHVVFCAHYDFYVPANYHIYFVTDAGAVVERTILRIMRHPGYGSPYAYDNDIAIGVLDGDVPSTIKCVKFLPDNWLEYLQPYVMTPSLRLNQEEEALVGNLNPATVVQTKAYHVRPAELKRLEFYYSLASPVQSTFSNGLFNGDSGNGGFVVINSQLILTNLWTYDGPGAGTSVTNQKAMINSMIATLDAETGHITGHRIEEFSFTPFKKLAEIPPPN